MKQIEKTIAQMEEYIQKHQVAGLFELRAWVRNLKEALKDD